MASVILIFDCTKVVQECCISCVFYNEVLYIEVTNMCYACCRQPEVEGQCE